MADLNLDTDKSLEELGSALLARKESISKKSEKRARKMALPFKVLTAALGINSVFQNAAKRRIEEIDTNNKLDLINSKTEAPRYSRAAAFVQPLLGFDGTVEEFKNDKQRYNSFRANAGQYVDPLIEASQVFADFGYGTHDQYKINLPKSYQEAMGVGVDSILENLLTKKEDGEYTYKRIVNAMQGIVPDELSESDLLKQIVGLSSEDLNIYKTQRALNRSGEYKSKSSIRNLVDNAKNALASIGILNEQEGGINLFKQEKFDDNKMIGGTLSDILDTVDFDAKVKTNLESYVTTFKDDPRRYMNSVNQKDLNESQALLENLAAAVQRGEKYDATGAYDFYEGTELQRVISSLKEDYPVNYSELIKNGTVLGKMIHDKPKLGRAIFQSDAIEDLKLELAEGKITKEQFIPKLRAKLDSFETNIKNNSNYARQYALLKTLKSGEAKPLDAGYLSQSKTYLGTSDFIYDHAKMLKATEKFLDETVQYDKDSDKYSLSSKFLNTANPQEIRQGILSFINRSVLEENLNQAQAESIQFLTDINAPQYFDGDQSIEDIYTTAITLLTTGK
jgi:hypothetical protein